MRGRATAVLVSGGALLASAVVAAGAGTPAPGGVERFAPGKALAAVRVKEVDATVNSLTALAGQRMSPIFLYMTLGRLVANTPLGPLAQGFDGKGDLLLVFLPPKTGSNTKVLVVPVSDYQQYLAGMTRAPGSKRTKDPSGLEVIEYTMRQVDPAASAAARARGDFSPKFRSVTVRRYVGGAGKWAVVAADREACLAVLAQKEAGSKSLFDLSATNQREGMGRRSILLGVSVPNLLETYGKAIESFTKGGMPMMPPMMPGMPGPEMPGPGMPGPGGIPGAGPGAAQMQAARRQIEQFLALVKQLDFLALGLESGPKGLSITAWATPREGTDLAALEFAPPKETPGFARFLSADSAFAGAASLDPKGLEVMSRLVMDLKTARFAPSPEAQARLEKVLEAYAAAIGGSMAVSLREPPAGAASMLYIDEIMAVKDPAAARKAMVDAFAAAGTAMSAPGAGGIKAEVKREQDLRSYKGLSIDRVTVTFDTSQADPQTRKVIAAMYPGGLSAEFTISDKYLLLGMGGEKPLDRVIDLVQAGTGGLSGKADYRLAMSGLPKQRDVEMYVSVKRLLGFMGSAAARMGASGMMGPMGPMGPGGGAQGGGGIFKMLKESLQHEAPVGASLVLNEWRLDVFVPQETIKALKGMAPGPGMQPGMQPGVRPSM